MKPQKKFIKLIILLAGITCLILCGVNWHISVAAWIAPVFLLYFTRNSKALGFLLFFVLLSFAGAISQTGNNMSNTFLINIINGLSYGFVYCLIYIIDRLLYKKGKGFYTTLIFPSLVMSFEYLITLKIGTFGIFAHSQYSFHQIAQLGSITGLFGITFLVIWFASVINWIIENNYSITSISRSLLIFGSILFVIFLFGEIRTTIFPPVSKTVKVATVNSELDFQSITEKEQKTLLDLMNNPKMKIPERFFTDEEIINKQIENTDKAAKEGAKIIVWNEFSLILKPQQVHNLSEKIKHISKTNKSYILIAFLEQNSSSKPKPLNNKSILFTPAGEIAWEYLKFHLHPYAEVPIINPGDNKIPYIDTDYGRLGNAICYDIDFPEYTRQTGKNSIDIMLVPAYDWEGITPLHPQMASFDAIQNGYSLIRSTGKGLNVVYDYHGNLIGKMNNLYSDSKILYADIPVKSTTTVYSKIGNVFVYICILFLIFIIVLRFAMKINNNKSQT